ncbi:MAG: prolipoprotein diacylglyceryl transferase [Clostridia bacterium]|nr:prolipoprotein diacylglyceryl transferase [Clostridia bacterium]
MKHYTPPADGFFIGNIEIKFYGLIMAFAMFLGVLLACKLAKKKGIKSDDIFMLALIVLPCAVVGARLYYCFFYEYDYTFWEIFKIWQGGLAIYGGVIGGIIGVIVFALIKKDWKMIFVLMDICAPCLILGQALGRWGNFFNQEAYGNLITNESLMWFPFGVWIESENAWFQATFFYESLWNLIGVAILIFTYYKTEHTGTTTAMYLVWYGLGRTWIEGLRSDSLYIGTSGIRVSQLLSMILVVVGLVVLSINIYKTIKKKREQKNG